MSANHLANYLRPRAQSSRWVSASIVALIAVGTCLCIQAYRLHQVAEQATVRNNKALAAQAVAVVPIPSRVAQETLKRWAALKVERSFPWPALFLAVERAANVNIELLEFQPDKQNRRIVLRGEARDIKALIVYLDALAAQAVLSNVHLVHQDAIVRDRLETVAFEIKAGLGE